MPYGICLTTVSLSALLALALAVLAWQRRAVAGGSAFVCLMLAIAVYAGGYAGELFCADPENMIRWGRFQNLGVATIPTFWLLFSVQYCGWEERVDRRWFGALLLFSLLTIAIRQTTHLHGLMFRSMYLNPAGLFPMLNFVPGPWYWVNVAYTNAAVLVGNLLFINLYRTSAPAYRPQVRVMLAASCIPWIALIAYLCRLTPRGLDVITISFSLTGVLFFYGMYRYRILDIVPIARDVLLDTMNEAVIAVDGRWRLRDCNRAAGELLGSAARPGERLDDVLAARPELLRALRGGDGQALELRDGEEHHLIVKSYPLQEDPVLGRLIVIHDATELMTARHALELLNRDLAGRIEQETGRRIENERAMMRQSRFAAMGEMTGAIAHQWRQPLTAVSALIQNIKAAHESGVLDGAFIDKTVDAAMRQCGYMSDTIDEFRGFFRPDKPREPFDVRAKLEEAVQLLAGQLCSLAIRVSVTGGTEPRVRASGHPGEFKQVIINLLVNARDAVTERRSLGDGGYFEGQIEIFIARKAESVEVQVSDNGCGVSEQIRERIFEPYFTTKQELHGTGIGLYTSKLMIESSMGGRLELSERDGLTCFTIELKGAGP
jgi:signal transduction histidine kinase